MKNYWESGFYSQPDKSQLSRNAKASREKAEKKGQTLEPVVIEGRKITKTWWGNAWCENLERYADYENRLDRGKRYVRSGTVLDLKIQKGLVLARVQGSRKTPYKVEIHISPLSEERCEDIIEKCGQRIQNIEALVAGNIPEDMQEIFLGQDGLFPRPKEISFGCSCPDWALMCKHVAAVLYGIGARLDQDPLLFFELRGIDPERFVGIALENKVEEMLKNEGKPSSRIMDGDDALELFGIGLSGDLT